MGLLPCVPLTPLSPSLLLTLSVCAVVKDACSPAQVDTLLGALIDTAEEDKALDRAQVHGWEESQLVQNLFMKHQVFRDMLTFEDNVAQNGPLIDKLLKKVMGEDFAIGCAHGSIVNKGGGLQEMHIDQGMVPMPYPPWPMGSLIIWMLSGKIARLSRFACCPSR